MEENISFSEKDKISVSQKKWLWLGIIIALLNPIFAGLLVGAFYLSEPQLKKSGIIVASIAILWGVILLYLIRQNLTLGSLGL